ncbi:MAG: carboxypeptidase regulatory-like domain-containing protein, partial [Acidobacteria bacterium]|nr:carboxypeptidase regulatory-like domain-containing protein [Acidobacteriota bacterium]
MMRDELRGLFSCLLAILCIAVSAWAQQRGTAGIYGSVVDSQGAVIPGAKVTLTHVATNQVRTAVSNPAGEYLFPLLPVGEYRISVEQPGFKKYEATGVSLQVNDNVKIDVKLEVGEISTSVTVESSGATVETSNATVKTVVDMKRVMDLPLNGRNLADLTLTVPGVQPQGGPDGDAGLGAYSARGAKQFSVNGSRQNNLKYTLDGGDNQDNLFNTNLAFPFPDAVQEFSVQTSNAGLEIGKSSGGAVNIVTKSGTNEYHGDVFWFIRNTNLNANGFFSRLPDGLKRNQGGFTLGGPVVKDKLFLFGGYQRTWLRQIQGGGQTLTMPAPFRNGDFSSLLQRNPPIAIKDPTNGQPFPNNIIPKSRQSPAAQSLLGFSPLPDPDGFTRYSLFSQEDTNDYVLRGDYRLNTKHSFLGRYFQQDFALVTPMVPNNIHSTRRGLTAPTKNATVGHTYIATTSLIADTHFTMAREV